MSPDRPPNSSAIDCTPERPYTVEVAVAEGARLKELHGPAAYHLYVDHDFPWPAWKRSPKTCPNCGHPL